MTADLKDYRGELLLALRLRDVPGPRIAEALAEVESHVAETGEDPLEAFGPPRAYADQLADSLGLPPGGSLRRALLTGWTWREVAVGLGAFAGTSLLVDGSVGVATREPAVLGLPAVLVLLAGVALLVAVGTYLVRRTTRDADPVLDPRTGQDMAPLPLWSKVVLVGLPASLLLAAVAVRLLTA
ncbi:hypothetical protein ICW40_14580 [Actinotalea ferrariae]|uniref:HAAS signaling domain-containing protein n=1 Tax=Actinotalea ferrariae TaxID=1386098 RepID=UPI001C8B708C|nr:hypothetical protein [Actinotalea ferrariae]MBX9246029.1 hypothetical protein [Actinotalea ferrariae]